MAYAGQAITIPLGQLGLMTDMAPVDVAQGALILAQNVALNNGFVEKAPGSRAFNEEALPAGVVGVYDWRPNKITQRLIAACSNGFLYIDAGVGANSFRTLPINAQDSNGTPVALTGLNPNCQFVAAGGETAGRSKKLFFFSRGQNPIMVLNSTTEILAPLSTPPADWVANNYPVCGVVFRNHLFAFAGQQSYMSRTGDHENFTGVDSGVQPVWPGEGGDIIAAFVYKTRLFCFKEDAYGYYLDDSDTDSDNWVWKKITSNFGVSATNAVIEVIDDMLTGNDTGTVTSYLATQALGDVAAGDVLQNAQIENYLRGNSSKAGMDVQHALYYPEKKLVFFTFRSAYYTYNDSLLVIDVNKTNMPRITFWRKGRPQCLALRKDATNIKRPMYGSTDGRVYLMDKEDRNEGGTAIKAEFQTAQMDFRQLNGAFANKNKLFDWLAVTYVPTGDFRLLCDWFIDGKYIDTVEFPLVQYLKPKLNTLHLNQDRLAQPNTETATQKLSGSGRVISFRFRNEGLNENFQVCSITVGFRESGEKAQKTE